MILVKDVKDSHTESNGTFRETKEFSKPCIWQQSW